MKQFKRFKNAYEYQYEHLDYPDDNDNGLNSELYDTGVSNIDDLAYAIKGTEVLWVIMADGYYLDDYEESATEYGVTKDGKWAAVYDSHCSCFGWEVKADDVTYYSNLGELLKCDKDANVILKYKDKLVELYPFLRKYFPKK